MDVYSGPYIGGGINYQYTIGDAFLLNDNLAEVKTDRINARDINLVRARIGAIGATINTGYGSFYDKYYFGLDFCADITNKKSHTQTIDFYKESKIKTAELVPTLAIRIGRFISPINSLIYARFGITALCNHFYNSWTYKGFFNRGFDCNKIVPVIGFGFEKIISNHYSIKFEGDYRFPANKKENNVKGFDEENKTFFENYKASIENKARGYAIRLMCIYHF